MSTPENTYLDKAKKIVYENRQAIYGNPYENFTNIAGLWNEYLAIKMRQLSYAFMRPSSVRILNHVDVAAMNILQKIARVATNPTHEDSWIDIAGYAATVEKILQFKASPIFQKGGVEKVDIDSTKL